jgi:putative sterol carrier protein
VAYFKDDQEVYETIGKLFVQLAEDEELGPKWQTADTIVQYQFTEPDSQITIRLREGEPEDVDFGPSGMEPELVMAMKADVAHRFWLGKVNVTMAIARGDIKPTGPVAKLLRLVPLTKTVFPRYRAMLEQDGRADLVEV